MSAEALSEGLKNIRKLCFERFNGWCPLPSWAHFFINLGEKLYRQSDKKYEERITIAISVPNRAFASAFISLGSVLGGLKYLGLRKTDDWLYELQQGDALQVRDKNKLYQAVFVGIVKRNGLDYVKCKRKKGSLDLLVPLSGNANVSLHPSSMTELRLTSIQKSLDLDTAESSVLMHLLGQDGLKHLQLESALNSVVITQKVQYFAEINDTSFGLPFDGAIHCLKLSDILRVKELTRGMGGYQTEVVPITGSLPKVEPSPPIIIFDGARGFFRNHFEYPMSNRIVIIDRCDTSILDCVSQLEQNYLYRIRDWDELIELNPPSELEFLAFVEKC